MKLSRSDRYEYISGTNDIKNLQVLTWFENRCKNNMSLEEWNTMKKRIGEYFI